MHKTIWILVVVLGGTLPAWGGATTVRGNGTGVVAASAERPPKHPVTTAQVYEILRLTGTDPMRRQMVDEMLPYLKKMMPYLPDDVAVDIETSLKSADFQGAMVRSFQQHLSQEDAAAILAFYKSPAGKRMIGVMPQILNEGEDAGSALGQEVMFQVIQRHKAEIDEAGAQYRAAHPEVAPGH